jgi:hypothetical protein
MRWRGEIPSLSMKPTSVLWNYTHIGHWNQPHGGFRISTSTSGKPIVPCVGNKTGWRSLEKFIHSLVHGDSKTNRIWLEFEDKSRVLIWWYQSGFDRKEVIKAGLSDALAPFDAKFE